MFSFYIRFFLVVPHPLIHRTRGIGGGADPLVKDIGKKLLCMDYWGSPTYAHICFPRDFISVVEFLNIAGLWERPKTDIWKVGLYLKNMFQVKIRQCYFSFTYDNIPCIFLLNCIDFKFRLNSLLSTLNFLLDFLGQKKMLCWQGWCAITPLKADRATPPPASAFLWHWYRKCVKMCKKILCRIIYFGGSSNDMQAIICNTFCVV